ncbi:flavodoxin domain-containing protein [Nocardia inohanensis]|uniref:flavodoxin domain-containing protein n=1 Tax=Nocardia inohanensis TaxID=209246 RepID=UPI00147160CF|nr:flavodoxin domain-containing protein [Nocardia inohanensis]
MKGLILVAYESPHGSTAEVAQRIAAELRASGFEVDCRAMREVRSIGDYRAIVVGAPFYFGRWPRAARRFLGRFGPDLVHRQVALFATGQVDARQPVEQITGQLDTMLRRYDWLHPVSVGMFGGRWDPDGLDGVHRWLNKLPASPLRVLPVADLRSWPDIDKWAGEVGRRFEAAAAQPHPVQTRAPSLSRAAAPFTVIREYLGDQQLPSRLRKPR